MPGPRGTSRPRTCVRGGARRSSGRLLSVRRGTRKDTMTDPADPLGPAEPATPAGPSGPHPRPGTPAAPAEGEGVPGS